VKAEILRPEFLEASSSSGPVTSTSFSSPENPPNNRKVQCDPQLFILSRLSIRNLQRLFSGSSLTKISKIIKWGRFSQTAKKSEQFLRIYLH
jgi:hypothetical protein